MSVTRKVYPPPAPQRPASPYPPGYVPPRGFRINEQGHLETVDYEPPPAPPAPASSEPAAQLQDGEADAVEVTGLVDLARALEVANRLARRDIEARCAAFKSGKS